MPLYYNAIHSNSRSSLCIPLTGLSKLVMSLERHAWVRVDKSQNA
ncbi:Uncharacterised protein [Candidatus Venteria ishoeyi]|uniref:Uncharacterized protein n=1 Tax=Candidatus Venteria ishoeyi TaxID=1899563 RepID=A0A1H6FBM9_9GAMM|nr:Uncharacterised protein [Candidatus Venteria ishoeyi]